MILVTGGNGLVGRHLNDILPKALYVSSKDYDLIDRYQTDVMLDFYKPNVVINLAAKVGGILDNMNNPVQYLEENTLINTNLLRSCYNHDVDKVISMGSTCMYPDVLDEYPMKEDSIFDGSPPTENFAYAMSKRVMATQIDSYVKEYNKNWSYLIPCNLYGEYDKYEEHHSHFVSALIKKIYEAENDVEIWGTGKPLRQFMYAGDLARVIKYIIENNIKGNFNVAPNYVHSIEEITKIGLKACSKEDLKINYNNTKPDGQYRKDVDSSKLMSVLKDFEFTSLEEGIRRVYDNFSQRHN